MTIVNTSTTSKVCSLEFLAFFLLHRTQVGFALFWEVVRRCQDWLLSLHCDVFAQSTVFLKISFIPHPFLSVMCMSHHHLSFNFLIFFCLWVKWTTNSRKNKFLNNNIHLKRYHLPNYKYLFFTRVFRQRWIDTFLYLGK